MSSQPLFVQPGTPPRGEGRPVVVLASGRQRVAARLIDFVAVLLAMMAPQVLVMITITRVDASTDLMATVTVASMLIMVWLWLFLRVFRLVLWGWTVGQRIAGIRVVRLDDLRFPGWKHAFRRWTPTWGGFHSPGSFPRSDLLAYAGDERTRRCLHDRTAGTVVVQAAGDEPARRVALAMTLPLGALAIVLAVLLFI